MEIIVDIISFLMYNFLERVINTMENVRWGTNEPIKCNDDYYGELSINAFGTYSCECGTNLTEEEVTNVLVNALKQYINNLSSVDVMNLSRDIDSKQIIDIANHNELSTEFKNVIINIKLTTESKEKINESY